MLLALAKEDEKKVGFFQCLVHKDNNVLEGRKPWWRDDTFSTSGVSNTTQTDLLSTMTGNGPTAISVQRNLTRPHSTKTLLFRFSWEKEHSWLCLFSFFLFSSFMLARPPFAILSFIYSFIHSFRFINLFNILSRLFVYLIWPRHTMLVPGSSCVILHGTVGMRRRHFLWEDSRNFFRKKCRKYLKILLSEQTDRWTAARWVAVTIVT